MKKPYCFVFMISDLIIFIIGFYIILLYYEGIIFGDIYNIGLIFSIILILAGALGPIILFFIHLSGFKENYPNASKSQLEKKSNQGLKYKIYYQYNQYKKKAAGFLDGNVIYYKNHKTVAGWFDDTNPKKIDFIWRGKIIERIENGIIHNTANGKEIGTIDNLRVSLFSPSVSFILTDTNISDRKANIIREDSINSEVIGKIEGDLNLIKTTHFYAILIFLFEITS